MLNIALCFISWGGGGGGLQNKLVKTEWKLLSNPWNIFFLFIIITGWMTIEARLSTGTLWKLLALLDLMWTLKYRRFLVVID